MFGFMNKKKAAEEAGGGSQESGGLTAARRTSSDPTLVSAALDDDHGAKKTSGKPAQGRDRYKNDFSDSGGLQAQTTEDLENYAVYKTEETTKGVDNCLRIAQNIREDATKTLDMLHQQGEQIERTHNMAVDMDKDLSKGEKLLNNLGGMFSKPWKPKKTREIKGPVITSDKGTKKSDNHKEQREKLGLGGSAPKSGSKTPQPEPTNAMQKVDQEKAKQDDGLSDLSDILGDLKGMAVDMGSELDKQNKALDHLGDDVDELNSRVKGANTRTRKLLEK